MNIKENQVQEYGLESYFAFNEMRLQMAFGSSESLFSYDTYQFKDYSKVEESRFDPEEKAKRREIFFQLIVKRRLIWVAG